MLYVIYLILKYLNSLNEKILEGTPIKANNLLIVENGILIQEKTHAHNKFSEKLVKTY